MTTLVGQLNNSVNVLYILVYCGQDKNHHVDIFSVVK